MASEAHVLSEDYWALPYALRKSTSLYTRGAGEWKECHTGPLYRPATKWNALKHNQDVKSGCGNLKGLGKTEEELKSCEKEDAFSARTSSAASRPLPACQDSGGLGMGFRGGGNGPVFP